MKRIIWIMLLCLVIPGLATAHSTKGKIKVPLAKKVLGVDDVAYYIERYVNKTKYKDRFKISKNRFFVWEFYNIRQDENFAEVFFKVSDQKKKDGMFDDFMVFKRNENGGWINTEAPEDKVYTYISKKAYYVEKYGFPASMLVVALSGIVVLAFHFTRKRKTAVA